MVDQEDNFSFNNIKIHENNTKTKGHGKDFSYPWTPSDFNYTSGD